MMKSHPYFDDFKLKFSDLGAGEDGSLSCAFYFVTCRCHALICNTRDVWFRVIIKLYFSFIIFILGILIGCICSGFDYDSAV